MSLIKRLVKGAPLTNLEGDENLEYLEGLGLSDLSDVLARGNTTGGNNIVLSNNDTINTASGSGQLDLRYDGTDNRVMLSTDGGAYTNEFISMEPEYVAIHATNPSGGLIEIFADNYDTGITLGGFGKISYDFSAYGKNGFILANMLTSGSERFDIKHNNRIDIDSPLINVTGDIEIESGKTINAASGGGQLDLRAFDIDNIVLLSNDEGAFNKCGLYMDDGLVQLYNYNSSIGGGDMILKSANRVEIGRGAGLEPSVEKIEVKENQIVFTSNMIQSTASSVSLTNLPTYADNADAIAGGLTENDVYKTATGELRIVV